LPEAAVPLLTNTDPLVPVDTAFAETRTSEPDVALELAPLKMDTEPPVCDAPVDAPALTTTAPPTDPVERPATRER